MHETILYFLWFIEIINVEWFVYSKFRFEECKNVVIFCYHKYYCPRTNIDPDCLNINFIIIMISFMFLQTKYVKPKIRLWNCIMIPFWKLLMGVSVYEVLHFSKDVGVYQVTYKQYAHSCVTLKLVHCVRKITEVLNSWTMKNKKFWSQIYFSVLSNGNIVYNRRLENKYRSLIKRTYPLVFVETFFG